MPTPAHLRAIALLQQGHVAAAADAFRAILEVAPQDAFAHGGLGHCQIRLGREDEAWRSLTTACSLSDGSVQAFSDLAWVAAKRNQTAVAAQAAERALALNPDDANARFVRAQVLLASGRIEEAEAAFAQALRAKPALLDARSTLGRRAFEQGDFLAASRHYAACAQATPQEAQAWLNLGLALVRAQQPQQARPALERAAALAPEHPTALALLALVLKDCGLSDSDLIPHFQRAVELAPDAAILHLQLAGLLFNEQDFRRARAHLERARKLAPDNLTARWFDFQMPAEAVAAGIATHDAYLARWREGIAYFEALDWNEPRVAAQAEEVATSVTSFHLGYLGKPVLMELQRHARVLRRLAQAAGWTRNEVSPRALGTRRRRVAIFAASAVAKSIGLVWSPTFLELDSAEFEFGVFSVSPAEDALTQRWRGRAARFVSGPRPVAAWIDALRAFAPDVLVFPDIGVNRIAQAVASVRNAPVQAASWAHPITSGMATMDYFLSAEACEPEDADAHYVEKLRRLPRLGAFLDMPAPVAAAAKPSEHDRTIRFLCTQSADKLHPAHDELFAGLLARVPDARLDILCSKPRAVADALATRLRAACATRQVDFDRRCAVLPGQPAGEYQRYLAAADICLDSLDFSGCITSLDALWNDLPIVTLPGQFMRGRQTGGMLRLLELPELIAKDIPGYVDLAARLARDDDWRKSIVARIRMRKEELFRDRLSVEGLARFLRTVEPAPA